MAEAPHIYLAESWSHFRDIRRIRNECREFMTHNQEEITLWRQMGFWLYHRQMGFKAYLMRHEGRAIAYGLLKTDAQGFEWVSGGVAAGERGKGYGKAIFAFLTTMARKPAYLDVFWDHKVARNLYRKLGWLEFERVDTALGTLMVMVHD